MKPTPRVIVVVRKTAKGFEAWSFDAEEEAWAKIHEFANSGDRCLGPYEFADLSAGWLNAIETALKDALDGKYAQPESGVRDWEIWSEGFAATGESGTATKIGVGRGETFTEAVRDYYNRNPNTLFDPERLTLWGCRLFDNETAARKAFG